MLKRRNIEACLGIGSVRAKVHLEGIFEPLEDTSEPLNVTSDLIENSEVESQETFETFNTTTEEQEEILISEAPQPDPMLLVMVQLEKQVASLEKQLEIKDFQLASKDDIIKNFQVLLKSEQDHVLKLTMNAANLHTPYHGEEPDLRQSEQIAWWKKWFK